ncbi:M14 family metallopeptidase [Flagellimonas meishanensis]|uniref:M14 family metallopeptidase n=1 Tax=Flagellimonas meishanensis TaxID=2873264 RepID=UPI001CA63BE6|nr:M14 family metallopeptidase [[Muricauda] meishanensis]
MKHIVPLLVLLLMLSCETTTQDETTSYQTYYEASNKKETATYQDVIAFYKKLAHDFPEVNIQTIGETDSGLPLHLVTFNPDGDFNLDHVRKAKAIILINNGIHPGESDGIDATMMLYRDLATRILKHPKNTVLVTIPVYNVGGALNRNSTTRVNQNGPLEYGFRGNAQNYDLNRDFIKLDSKNAKTFTQIFHSAKPDVFVENHVSNGADYQYTLTHLFTQHNKMGGKLGHYLNQQFRPNLEKSLMDRGWDITPYVNVFNRPPEYGFSQFLDHPRYSTGYTTLWNTLGLMVETHMLKPYKQRVEGTYQLMLGLIDIVEQDHENIRKLRQEALEESLGMSQYHFNWQVDSTRTTTLTFKGYEAEQLESPITGWPRLRYDQSKPFTKETDYYNIFVPMDTISVPEAYVVGKEWHKIVERLDANQIDYVVLDKDSMLTVEAYTILDFETRKMPYEGHYLHYDAQVEKEVKNVSFRAGDLIIPTQQPGIRYLLETLEPQGADSFFNWNFFDTVLQRKESFSPYVFEDIALKMLQSDSVLRNTFLRKKEKDFAFSENWYAQLDWIYEQSKYLEDAYRSYPVYRIAKKSSGE